MTLLLNPAGLPARRAAAAGPLAPLFDSLVGELEPLLGVDLPIPREKAVLTRIGGRCAADGAFLAFDPRSPRAHRCPRCGAEYAREEDYRWWIVWYHLWLAERAVHGALFHLLAGDPLHARFADDVLLRYAEQYLRWPNEDNALGPTRPFFSTYLESVWLLQLCLALDLREAGGAAPSLGATVRERLIVPSRALVASFDEGLSNRQTWNDAALLAAARLLGDGAGAERAVLGPSGLVRHLDEGLLADGSWYEGENYHLFAHRALWYGVTMCERAGIPLPAPLVARFQEGFATPFLTALPDFTFPSRRDSQYAVSLRQWRFAELAELGLARGDDARLTSALATLYAPDAPDGDTGRARSTADVEFNRPPARLDRADLGWKSLLAARAELPRGSARPPVSVVLEGQGVAVVRRDAGRVYVGVDYGHSGGGHGHPDRLGLVLVDGATRWLDDPGTGSYVSPTLHWYRSTLAHSAPLVDGRSQRRTHGHLRAWEDRGGAGWVRAEAEVSTGVWCTRTVVVMPDYLVDELEWRSAEAHALDLPIHVDGEVAGGASWLAAALQGAAGLENGFDWLHDTERLSRSPDIVHLAARAPGTGDAGRADLWVELPDDAELWRARAPGPPGAGERRFHLVRARGTGGAVTSVWSWKGAVRDVRRDQHGLRIEMTDGTTHVHAPAPHGWHVDLHAGSARSSIDLGGLRELDREATNDTVVAMPPGASIPVPLLPAGSAPLANVLELAEAHYRRSEVDWREAGAPTARILLWARDDALHLTIDVRKRDPVFVPAGAENPLDNERAEINGDGVQLYLAPGAATEPWGWLLVPETASGAVRVVRLDALPTAPEPHASWERTLTGYLVRIVLPLAACAPRGAGRIDVLVNETAPGRARRRGQLVLSGARGEWVYLRGDRQPADRLLPFVVA